MKISTALFASIVAICCTVGIVNSQIMFADGSVQNTAFNDTFSIPSGDAFSYYQRSTGSGDSQLSDTVPSGRELVILKIYKSGGGTQRFEAKVNGSEPIIMASPSLGVFSSYSDVWIQVLEFPNGTCVVDEGYQLWLFDMYGFSELHVLGYYRDK